MKKYIKKIGSCSLCFFVSLVLFSVSVFSVSCKMTAEGIITASDDVKNPVLSEFSHNSTEGLVLSFSEKVHLSNLEVRSNNPSTMGEVVYSENQLRVVSHTDTPMPSDSSFEEESKEENACLLQIDFSSEKNLEPGAPYVLSGMAHDEKGNSLLFQVPFHGFNRDVAGLVLSEVRTETSNIKTAKARIEFVELYVHSPGNLAGISLTSIYDEANYGEYVFPSAEVDAGEYIVVHFRTMEEHEAGCIDETGSNLNASTAPDSCADVRDFWVPGTSARLSKSDIIVLQERSGGQILDALLYAQSNISKTALNKLEPAVQAIIDSGAWSGSEDISTWVCGDGLTTTRTLSRQNIAEIDLAAESGLSIPVANLENWFVVANSSHTPGLPNSTKRYTK